MKNKKAIIFDLDNTLYDFSNIWLNAHEKIFNITNLNKKIEYKDFLGIFKNFDKEVWQEVASGKLKVRNVRFERIIRTMNYFDIEYSKEDASNYYNNMFSFIEKQLVIDKELITILLQLKRKYKLFILTNGIALEQKIKIKKLGFTDIFDKEYISSETMINKPNLRIFLKILVENNLNFEDVIMIGDSYYHDIDPALKLGIATCYVKKHWHLTSIPVKENKSNYTTKNLKKFLKKLL